MMLEQLVLAWWHLKLRMPPRQPDTKKISVENKAEKKWFHPDAAKIHFSLGPHET